ncbi:hypothetical protein NEOKW01_0845 [Nematocida sp. AWRm80]|nr:hypothetical protein NEOKW01_0845 [Nematocida sp. AWRm80]
MPDICAGEDRTESPEEIETPVDTFDFDAPRTRDFTKEEYQKQKRIIEKLLREHGHPGEPQDPMKHQKKKLMHIEEAAPRKTFFSNYFKDTAIHQNKDPVKNPKEVSNSTVNPDESVNDHWFEEQKESLSQRSEDLLENKDTIPEEQEYIHKQTILTDTLFESEEETNILPHLKIMSTPPIKTTNSLPGVEFKLNPSEIQELNRVFQATLPATALPEDLDDQNE